MKSVRCASLRPPQSPRRPPHRRARHPPHSSFSFMKHLWEASWAPEKEADRAHLSVLNLIHRIEIFGVHIPPLDLHVTATQVGRWWWWW